MFCNANLRSDGQPVGKLSMGQQPVESSSSVSHIFGHDWIAWIGRCEVGLGLASMPRPALLSCFPPENGGSMLSGKAGGQPMTATVAMTAMTLSFSARVVVLVAHCR